MIPHPHQALATLNAVGLAFAVWRDRRELNFVEAIVAGRRAGKQRRADARRWRTRKKVPSGANRVARPSSGGASVQNEQVDEGPAAPNGAAALAPVTEATLKTCQSRVRSAVAPRCGGDGQLAVSPSVLAERAARVDDDHDDISPTSGGDGEIMTAPVRRGRGNKSGPAAPDLNDTLALAADDEPQATTASAHVSAEVIDTSYLLPWPMPSPLPSPLPSPPDRDDVRDGTDHSELSTTETAEASEIPSVWLSEVALAKGSGVWDEEKDLMRGIVRAENGTILSQMGPETGWSGSNKWKRLKLGKDQLILTKRWHKGHDRCHKRLWLSCKTSHTALAGLIYRGAGGLSRAQTVQVLANSLALEIVVLCMQYSVSSEVLEINLVTTFMASLFAALVCIPSMTIFAAAFNPQIAVNFLKAVATCPGKAWRSRRAILYGLCCCPCKAWGQAVQLINARAASTTVRARWRKARRRLKLFTGMAAPAPHQMERDCDAESTSPPTAPAKNSSIIRVRPRFLPASSPSSLADLPPVLPPFSPKHPAPAVWLHLVAAYTSPQARCPVQVYRQAVEAERKEQLLEKHRKGYVAGDTRTDLAARLRERRFEYASLNEHLLMLSLTRAVRTTALTLVPSPLPLPSRAPADPDLDPTQPQPRTRAHSPLPSHSTFALAPIGLSVARILTPIYTSQVRMREWHHASRIALGWLLNQCAFVGMLCIYVVYGCAVRSLSAEDNSQVAGHAPPEPHRPGHHLRYAESHAFIS